MRYALLLTTLVAACAGKPDAQECETGITCPPTTKCAAVQPVCITNDCGDGIVQSTEVCDDGNIEDGDGCAANCQSRETCGDGVLNAAAGELCDDNNTTGGDGCAADCRSVEICGNGIRDVNEACDDGNTLPGDGCSGNCKSTEICGNNIVDLGEKCDDGSAPGGCNDDCQGGTGCGDGAIDIDGSGNALEECDDGNSNNQDDCTTTCKLNVCGDGIQQTSGARIEDCDPSVDFGETAGCNIDCTATACGDNKINNVAGEECDDGPSLNADDRDCTSACHLNRCGDMLANTTGPSRKEDCDDGNTNNSDMCPNTCKTPVCGNGLVEAFNMEACDDGNQMNGDGCSSSCKFEKCGDGRINNGEACDGTGTASVTGTPGETATCNADCTARSCGDGKVNQTAGEQCDDANSNDSGDKCRNNCKLNVCGDGVQSDTEACDDGNQINTDTCTNACALVSCGDGVRQGAEQCDDGNGSETDGCLNNCTYNTCGDGKLFTGVEECDNGAAGNGLTKNCLPNCKTNICGDRAIDQEGMGASVTEACDDGNTMTETGCAYGVSSCTACSSDCDTVLNLNCNICGDGAVDMTNEQCDDNNTVTETACPYGSPGGNCNICNSTCQTVAKTGGAFCGDNSTNGPEACDDGNTMSETACAYGTATCSGCSANCLATLSLKGNVCGDSVIDAGNEQCDDGNAMTEASCAYGAPNGMCTVCNSTCQNTAKTGPWCGDGTTSNGEVCDDRSPTQSCGTCNNSCTVASAAAAATGYIGASDNAGGNIGDGDTMTFSDGSVTVKFEFDKNGTAADANAVLIDVSGTLTATQVRDKIAAAFATAKSGKGLRINTADAGAAGLALTNIRTSKIGNTAITPLRPGRELLHLERDDGWRGGRLRRRRSLPDRRRLPLHERHRCR